MVPVPQQMSSSSVVPAPGPAAHSPTTLYSTHVVGELTWAGGGAQKTRVQDL